MQATASANKLAVKDQKQDDKTNVAGILVSTEKPSKRELYIKIFKQEFIRELEYLWDVANKRAVARDAFIDTLANLLTAAAPSVPVVGSAAATLASTLQFAANQVRDKEIMLIANLRDQLDLPRLNVVADILAREAYRRYEFFIINRLHDEAEDGVIPFAKVGVQRVLEHLVRKRGGVDFWKVVREQATVVLGDAKQDPTDLPPLTRR